MTESYLKQLIRDAIDLFSLSSEHAKRILLQIKMVQSNKK